MSHLDRTMITALAAAIVFCGWAFTHVAGVVDDLERHPRHVEIIDVGPTTTTTPPAPSVCVVDGTDPNWAARMGVPDQPRCA